MEIGSSLSLMSFVGALDVRHITRSLFGTFAQDRALCQVDFDVDQKTGFFPSNPLPKLPEHFAVWEQALTNAQGNISHCDDESPEAVAKRPYAQQWRANVRSVSDLHDIPRDIGELTASIVASTGRWALAQQCSLPAKGTHGLSLHPSLLCPFDTYR
jgi:hypothetical protein